MQTITRQSRRRNDTITSAQCLTHTPGIGLLLAAAVLVGCRSTSPPCTDSDCYDYQARALQIEYPDVSDCDEPSEAANTLPPRSLDDEAPREFWDLEYEHVLRIAMSSSEVLRDLGLRGLTSPGAVPSVFDPAITESDPLYGTAAALSEFDAQLSTSLFWAKNDRAVNNAISEGTLPGLAPFQLRQDTGAFRFDLSKTAATGTRYSLRNLTFYDQSNQSGNFFNSGWDTAFELEARQPFLQGGGIAFNRIAGPDGQPGFNFSNGVLVARINTDISLADFEQGVRDFVSQLEEAYWDLYFAYRDLDAKVLARDSALDTWRSVQAKTAQQLRGGEADKEAQAREQYFLFESLVQDALSGNPQGGRSVGIYRAERRLRLMMGLPSNDGRLIRPADEPSAAKVAFSWGDVLDEALTRRVELRRQKWQIKRSELELIATRNFTLPRLDGVALYRMRGFGDDLTGDGGGRFASAFKDLGSGDHQEWQLGLQLDVPIGLRQAWAGVRNAELKLARERAILRDQELAVSHTLSDAIAEVIRAQASVRTNFDRLNAAVQRRNATQAAYEGDQASLDLLLGAQQRLSDAQSSYFQALAQHSKAIKDVQLQKGSLLQYNGILLSEGAWSEEAYQDAEELQRRWRPKHIDYRFTRPDVISQGEYPQIISRLPDVPDQLPFETIPVPPPGRVPSI
ncbi:MAG: TolC family protein [Planctomycetota bacterium]|nr:TolC family protein [Planctomycetota bacterium]